VTGSLDSAEVPILISGDGECSTPARVVASAASASVGLNGNREDRRKRRSPLRGCSARSGTPRRCESRRCSQS
jgi:hypothetical protein